MLDDAGEAFPPQAHRYFSWELLSSSILATSVLTRIKSLHNPAGDVLGKEGQKNCKDSSACTNRSQKSKYIGDQEGHNVG